VTHYPYQPPSKTFSAVPVSTQLLFLTFHLRGTGESTQQVTLVGTQIVPGSLKPVAPPISETTYLRVSQLDAQQRILVAHVLPHPLYRQVEQSTPAGTLTRRIVRVREADFVVRMALQPAITTLRVEEVVASTPGIVATFPFSAP
jgi:hypothetical protein